MRTLQICQWHLPRRSRWPRRELGENVAILAGEGACDPGLATKVGRASFPPAEAERIAELVRRDLPYYRTDVSRPSAEAMNRFARAMGILSGDGPFEAVVAA